MTGAALKSVPARLRPCEKVSLSNQLNSRAPDETKADTDRRAQNQAPAPSRRGTEAFAPYWHGPRLRPAFVAQVLGQFFPGRAERAPSTAYGGELPNIARLYDDLA